jgi:hypothetical protein
MSKSVRRANGQVVLEMSMGLIALLPVLLCIFDLIVIVIGISVNDAVCREVTRVASTGSPEHLMERAKSVVSKSALYHLRGAVGNIRVVEKETSKGSSMTPDKTIGGTAAGEATVTTSIEIYPPFIVGAAHKQVTGNEKIVCFARQTMPYSFTVTNDSEN